MNKKAFAFTVLVLFLSSKAWGLTPLTKGMGARALAMGEAFTGLADDGGALFTNPAGLTSLSTPNLINMYSSPSQNKQYITLGAVLPNRLGGTIGLGYNNFTTFNVLILALGETADYINQEILLSYSRKMNENLSLGGDVKFFLRGLSKDIYPPAKGNGLDLDLSFKYSSLKWLGVGANLQNVLPVNLGGKFENGSGEVEGIPANFKIGASAKIWGENAPFQYRNQELLLNFDLEKTSTSPTLLHLGTEWRPVNFFAVRAGLSQFAALVGDQTFTNLTLGIGLKYAGITFDYAYYQLGEATKRVEHYFSLGYIGAEKLKVVPTVEARPIKHFKDVPSSHWAKEPIEVLGSLGIMPGFPDDTFQPDRPVTRGELTAMLNKIYASTRETTTIENLDRNTTRVEGVVMIVRYAGISARRLAEPPYADVPGRHWAAASITAAKEAGILRFLGEKFEPQKELTRAEVAEMLYRSLK